MKKRMMPLALAFVLSTGAAALAGTAESALPFLAVGRGSGLSAGYAVADITPGPGIFMPGYFIVREAKGVLDPLEAICVAFSDGARTALLMTIDCADSPDSFANDTRAAVAKATGVPADAILLHATHSHTGADLRGAPNRLLQMVPKDVAAEKLRRSEDYIKSTRETLVGLARAAIGDLKPAKLAVGRTVARRISFGRRYVMKDGKVRTNPGVLNPDIVRPAGSPPDEEVQLVRIDRAGADPIAIVNFQTHPDVIGGERLSADWPGFTRRTLSQALGGKAKCIFVNGTEGDVNHVCVDPTPAERIGLHSDFDGADRGYAHAQHMGAVVAGAALSVWYKCVPVEATSVRFGKAMVRIPSNRPRPEEIPEAKRIDALHKAGRDAELPYKGMDLTTRVAAAERMIELEHGPDHFDLPLFAIGLGDAVAFGGFPGEPFNDIGKAVKRRSPFKMTVPLCLTNGDRGYFPFSDNYKEGGYEAESSLFGPSVADDLIAGQLKLLKGICVSEDQQILRR